MPEPLAYLLTWTTYGTWLPGDQRGWVRRGEGLQAPDAEVRRAASGHMKESACTLDVQQRLLVETTIRNHCAIRGWELYAVSVRANHVHVVVAAACDPKTVRDQLKAWCTRALKDAQRTSTECPRVRWWTERGSVRFLGDEESLEDAVRYVEEGQ